jgi:acyl-CoA thioester hydrolase
MTLHIDMAAKKVAPWPADVMQRLAGIKAAHSRLPLPDGAGRRIGMAKTA